MEGDEPLGVIQQLHQLQGGAGIVEDGDDRRRTGAHVRILIRGQPGEEKFGQLWRKVLGSQQHALFRPRGALYRFAYDISEDTFSGCVPQPCGSG